jgi:hypothetical protein
LISQWPQLYPEHPIRKIVIYYGADNADQFQPLEQQFGKKKVFMTKNLELKHLGDDVLGPKSDGVAILVCDDPSVEFLKSDFAAKIYSAYSHHRNLVPFTVVQQMFCCTHPNW